MLRPLYSPSVPVKVVPPSPAASTLTVLAGPGDFALKISRWEYCQEQERGHSRTNAGGKGFTIPRNEHKCVFESDQVPVGGGS